MQFLGHRPGRAVRGCLDGWSLLPHRFSGGATLAPARVAESPRRDVAIRRTLRRTLRWSARLDEERIRFQVRRGKVRLEGSVDSIGQRNELTRIARGAGAVEVENRLAIGLP